eukprot:684027-Pyramimonas_sp.AAC.1
MHQNSCCFGNHVADGARFIFQANMATFRLQAIGNAQLPRGALAWEFCTAHNGKPSIDAWAKEALMLQQPQMQ